MSEFYIYIVKMKKNKTKKKQLLCIQGTEGVTGQGSKSKQKRLSRSGSIHVFLVGGHVCFNIPRVELQLLID